MLRRSPRAVPVIAVDDGDATSGGGGEHGASIGVTVLVSPDQAVRLAFSAAVGTLAIAIAPPESAAP